MRRPPKTPKNTPTDPSEGGQPRGLTPTRGPHQVGSGLRSDPGIRKHQAAGGSLFASAAATINAASRTRASTRRTNSNRLIARKPSGANDPPEFRFAEA